VKVGWEKHENFSEKAIRPVKQEKRSVLKQKLKRQRRRIATSRREARKKPADIFLRGERRPRTLF